MGSGNCIYWAAKVFDVADDMVAVVIGDPDAHRERVELAAEHCPTNAIRSHPLDLCRDLRTSCAERAHRSRVSRRSTAPPVRQ